MPKGAYPRRSRPATADLLWEKVSRGAPDECWPYARCKDSRGYGRIWFDNAFRGAHQVAWELANGRPRPDNMFVCHSCDNPPCCNPDHLFLGTHVDNMRDMVAKGRCWQQKKTHCPRGHEYNDENTYRYRSHRCCRPCNRIASVKKRRKLEAVQQ